ncbi:MAG: TlpA disulfide reductase family protein [Nitrospirota bacterium]
MVVLLGALSLISCGQSEKGAAGAAHPFTLPDIHNNKVALNDYRGKVVLIEFFATWCPPCQMSAPDIQYAYAKYRDKGFVVLAVSMDEGPDAVPAAHSFAKEFGLSFPILMDDGTVSSRYAISSIPTSVVIDREGKMRHKHIGAPPDLTERLSKEIEALL